MSNTCFLEITFPKADLPKFNKILKKEIYNNVFWDDEIGDDNHIHAIIYEANYGWYNEIHALAAAGLTFTVSTGPGGDYGPCIYACYQGDLVECSADWDGNPVIIVGPKGIDESELNEAIKYHQIKKKIEEELR